jgi:hypothetical protein
MTELGTKRATNNKKANGKTGFGKFVRIEQETGASGNPSDSPKTSPQAKPDGAAAIVRELLFRR